jgi:hypothetical protein
VSGLGRCKTLARGGRAGGGVVRCVRLAPAPLGPTQLERGPQHEPARGPRQGSKEGPKRATFWAPERFGAGLVASQGPREPPPGTPRPLRAHPPTAQKFFFLSNPAMSVPEHEQTHDLSPRGIILGHLRIYSRPPPSPFATIALTSSHSLYSVFTCCWLSSLSTSCSLRHVNSVHNNIMQHTIRMCWAGIIRHHWAGDW